MSWLCGVDPCVGFECSAGEQCKSDDWRRPSCVCRTLCSYDYKPVCANDGRTYNNDCVMNAEACKNRVRLRVVHTGECTPVAGACHVTTMTTSTHTHTRTHTHTHNSQQITVCILLCIRHHHQRVVFRDRIASLFHGHDEWRHLSKRAMTFQYHPESESFPGTTWQSLPAGTRIPNHFQDF